MKLTRKTKLDAESMTDDLTDALDVELAATSFMTATEIEAQLRTRSHDPVQRPRHYTAHPSGVECIQITEHMNFCRGNAVKYIWRAGEKGSEIEDLKKARWYIDREIARLEKAVDSSSKM